MLLPPDNVNTGEPMPAGALVPGSKVEQAPAKKRTRWPWLLAGGAIAASAATVLWRIYVPQADVWTNDAYVRVHYTTIASRVAGQITSVAVDNNQMVKTGDLLVQLDDRDFRAALDTAQATLTRDRAAAANATANISRQTALIAQADAQLTMAKAQLSFAEKDASRYNQLASTGAGTVKMQQQADTSLLTGEASVSGAKAALEAARAQLTVAKAEEDAAMATVKADEARLTQAHLNLSYTQIRAPVDGMIGQRAVQVGNYVNPGAGLMAVVPLSDVYIEANYREVQLKHVQAGQHARIHVDAYDIDLKGTVLGVPAATGTTFAAIKSENATGNFTKIVQRLPVQIMLSPNQPLARLLRVGLSVEATVETGLEDVVGAHRTLDANLLSRDP
ncbi:HlyD family secretion protein [Bradyrhizobium mercantei]|uniref:HlyD family secretion protein n=1 Tax=Bradyrhizobium mercantei TaxID=1904807 RepID=UPI0009FA9577|nr:HlyD family secretion protein [Bradyrhizobium mercantei]